MMQNEPTAQFQILSSNRTTRYITDNLTPSRADFTANILGLKQAIAKLSCALAFFRHEENGVRTRGFDINLAIVVRNIFYIQ